MHLEEEAAPLLRAKLFPVLLELHLGDKKAQNTSHGGRLIYPNLDMARILLCRIKSSKLGQYLKKGLLMEIIAEAGLTKEEFLKLLKEI